MEFKLPFLGENVKEAAVLSVLVHQGDHVEKDQPLLELESEKATFEVPAPQAGTVGEVRVSKGDKVGVGQTVLTLDEGEPKVPPSEKEEAPEPRTEQAAPAEQPRTPERAEPEKEREEPAPPAAPATAEAREEAPTHEATPAAGPATRRLARELGVELAEVQGTGSGGRITPEDVTAFSRDRRPRARAPAPSGIDFERWGPIERRPLSGIEKTALRRLAASWAEIPHVTHHDLADVTALESAREKQDAERRPSDPKLTVTALAVKAVVAALRAFPRFGSSLDTAREELIVKQYVHIGIAVDTEHGLLVPVLREADRKTMRQIAAEIASLAERARQKKLLPDEMQGATFTITNLGGIGGTAFTPIIPHPEVAILGLARTREEPALRDGQLAKRLVLPLSLSYDHRVINGADAARFVRYVAGLLEDPLHLLMEA